MRRKMSSVACGDCDRTFVCDQYLKIHRDFVHPDTQCKECRRVLETMDYLKIHTDFCHSSYYVNNNSNPELNEEISADEFIPDDDARSTSSEQPSPKIIYIKKLNKKMSAKKVLRNASNAQPTRKCKKSNKNNDKKRQKNRLEVAPKGNKKSNNNNNTEKAREERIRPVKQSDDDGFKSNMKMRECKLCGLTCQVRRLDKHMLRVHGIAISCRFCGLACKMRTLLKKHERETHADALKAEKVCKQCGKSFTTMKGIREHVTHVHSKESRSTRVCHLCGKMVTSYIQHMQTHSEESPYSCEICGQRFRAQRSMKRHMDIHEGTKNHQCELCGNSYRWLRNLNEHKKTMHDGEEKFKCNVCGRSFKWHTSLKIHKNSHQIIPLAAAAQSEVQQQQTPYTKSHQIVQQSATQSELQPQHAPYSEPTGTTLTDLAHQTNYDTNNQHLYHPGMFWGLNPGAFGNIY